MKTVSLLPPAEETAVMSALIDPNEEIMISVRQLRKYYRVGNTRVPALNGVDFDVKSGEFCAIVGTSGSGKSTLLNLLAGLEPPTGGSIVINNKKLSGMRENDLVRFRREHVGFIFQSFNLISSLTAIENVALPLMFRGESKSLRERKALQLLKIMGLGKHVRHRPSEMSGGQQQRVGIARALVVSPDIVFADEPTGNLDSRTSVEIMELIQGISKKNKQTLIMVTHDNNLAQFADRIFRISDGKLISVEAGNRKLETAATDGGKATDAEPATDGGENRGTDDAGRENHGQAILSGK